MPRDVTPDRPLRPERFVAAIVAGGLSVIAGLWLMELSETAAVSWGVGVSLVLAGLTLLGGGIGTQIQRGYTGRRKP